MKRGIRAWGPGYPDADVPPMTERERLGLERRKQLEPPDAGRRKPGAPNMHSGSAPDTLRTVGIDEYDGIP